MQDKNVFYDIEESVWKFGRFVSKFPDDMLSQSLVFGSLPDKGSKVTEKFMTNVLPSTEIYENVKKKRKTIQDIGQKRKHYDIKNEGLKKHYNEIIEGIKQNHKAYVKKIEKDYENKIKKIKEDHEEEIQIWKDRYTLLAQYIKVTNLN